MEMLAEEALRTRRFPGVTFRGAGEQRRPWVIGTALDVWEIVAASRRFASPEEMAAGTDLSAPQVRLALAYYAEYPEGVDDAIRGSEAALSQLQREFPAIDTVTADE
jgi:uncharacterized protein (DUF433 family)